MFRSLFPIGDVLEHERDRNGIFAKPFSAQSRLIPIATFRNVIILMEQAGRATWPVGWEGDLRGVFSGRSSGSC
jgi:hypothetical protein